MISDFPAPQIFGPHQATLVLGDRIKRTTGYFGIYADDGQPIQESDVVSGIFTTTHDPDADLANPVETVTGPCLFAGLATWQFGHVLLNSLGRLWALSQLPADTTLVFTGKRAASVARYPHIRSVLDTLGINNSLRVLTEPTRFDAIHTATDQFGERFNGLGSPFFYDWLDKRVPVANTRTGKGKLYVGRCGLGPGAGRFACEPELESLLQADGYEVFHPEKHGLHEQFAKYASAEKIIFAEGSALHAFALHRQPNQQVAVIQRRASLPPLIATQMNDRQGPEVLAINAIDTIYWPPVRGDHYSVALLDFKRLRQALHDGGFLSDGAIWEIPDIDTQAASLVAGLKPGEKMHDAAERDIFLRELRQRRRARRARGTV